MSAHKREQNRSHHPSDKQSLLCTCFLRLMFSIIIVLICTHSISAQNFDTTHYDSGNYSIHARTGNGKIEGLVYYYDKNHTITKTLEYKNGIKDGIATYYYEGKKYLIIPYKDGLYNGEVVSYHSNGKMEWSKPYKYDKMIGQRIVRDSIGNLVNGEYTTTDYVGNTKFTINCIEGFPHGKFKIKQFDGTIVLNGQYLNGYPDGIFTYYDAKGKIISEELYEMGRYIKEVGNNYGYQVETYTNLLKNEPNNIRWLMLRAEARLYRNEIFLAKEDFNLILDIDSLNVTALYNLGYLSAADKEYKFSEQYFLKCIELDNNFYRAYYNLGYVYYQSDNYKAAIKYFSEAIRIKPNYSDAYYNRAQVYITMGDKKRADADMKKYKKLEKRTVVSE